MLFKIQRDKSLKVSLIFFFPQHLGARLSLHRLCTFRNVLSCRFVLQFLPLVTCRFTDSGGAWGFSNDSQDPQPQAPPEHFGVKSLCSDPTVACVSTTWELRISCRTPGADHPPLFSLVKEPKGNHISRWIPSLFICTMLITASKKDQSYLNYPQSLQPPEDSPQYENNEVKTASTFIFTLLSKWVIFVRSESFWPGVPFFTKCSRAELKIADDSSPFCDIITVWFTSTGWKCAPPHSQVSIRASALSKMCRINQMWPISSGELANRPRYRLPLGLSLKQLLEL